MTTTRDKVVAKTVRRYTNKLVDAMLSEIAPDKKNDPKTQASAFLALARIMVSRAQVTYPSAPRLGILLKAFQSDLLSETGETKTQEGRKTASGIILPT